MDRILIRDLRARCILGVRDEERRERQDVTINLTLFADLAPAGATDSLDQTVDYREVKKRVLALVEQSHCFLAEALAEQVARVCFDSPRVRKVRVRIEKPSALRFARSVGVQIERERPSVGHAEKQVVPH